MASDMHTLSRLSVEDVLRELGTSKDGLTDRAAKETRDLSGPNVIAEKEEVGAFLELLSHFKSPLVIILFIAASVSAYFGETTNSIIIGMMIIASVTLDFFEEHSASKAAKKLKEKVGNTATVIRGGVRKEVPVAHITLGDLIFLSSGDLVPADARLIEADDFFVNQSSLTGESYPCEKNAAIEHDEIHSSFEISNMIFFGSNVVSGTAIAAVHRIGRDTEFGKVAHDVLKREEKSDFELGVVQFGYFIMKVIFVLVMVIFLFNTLLHKDVVNSFLFAIAIAVGITPELLPMIMSITMARGSVRMSRAGVIVKRLSAIPNFGGMNILCTDKTGTLTEDKITLVSYTDVLGNTSDDVFMHTYLNSMHQTGVKNPLDKAVLEYRTADVSSYEKIEEIPFDFVRKMMSIAVVSRGAGRVLITKGAPEEVIERCSRYFAKGVSNPLSKERKELAFRYYERLSADGFRVLAVARKTGLPEREQYTHKDENDLELLGFVSFLDPAKKDVKHVLAKIEELGVEIKVITGDNELVAQKICSDVGLISKGTLLGREIDEMTDDALKVRAANTTIFARFSPDEKNRVIAALRSGGNVVGYMGDGINDAPSLRTADVGISVNNAVDIAKESADIILTHKSLNALIQGVIEGRRSFGNTMKYVMMGLSSNFGNMFSVVVAIFFLPFLPMLPIQILLNNFIYDLSQTTIPTDTVDDIWVRRPKKWDLGFIKKFMYVFGTISSVFDILTFFILFSVLGLVGGAFQTGWFLESLATQIFVIHVIRTNKVPFLESRPSMWLLISTVCAVGFGWLIPYTPIGAFFSLEPLPLHTLVAIAGIVGIYLMVVQLAKRSFYRKFSLA